MLTPAFGLCRQNFRTCSPALDKPHCDIRRCSSPLVESFVAPIYSFRSEEYIPFLWYNVKRLVLRGADHVEVKYFLCDIRWHKQRPWQPRLPNIFYQLIDMVCAEGRVGYKDIIVRHGPSCNLLVKVFILVVDICKSHRPK